MTIFTCGKFGFFAAPNMTSASSAPIFDDETMTTLGLAEAIIEDEVGKEQLSECQENQLTAFKVRLL